MSELRKILSFCLLLILVSCQTSDSSYITEEEVVKVIQGNGIQLVEADFPRGNAFGTELRNVTPGSYLLNEKPFFIYEFENEKEIQKAIREFAKKPKQWN